MKSPGEQGIPKFPEGLANPTNGKQVVQDRHGKHLPRRASDANNVCSNSSQQFRIFLPVPRSVVRKLAKHLNAAGTSTPCAFDGSWEMRPRYTMPGMVRKGAVHPERRAGTITK